MSVMKKGWWFVVVGLSALVGTIALALSESDSASGQSSCVGGVGGLISQATAEGIAVGQGSFNRFLAGNGGDPTVTASVIKKAYELDLIHRVGFGSVVDPQTCLWYVTLSGVATRAEITGKEDATGSFIKMNVGIKADNGHVISEWFYTANHTPEPTASGPTPTWLPIPTVLATPTNES